MGHRGVLFHKGFPVAYFSDQITSEDEECLQSAKGFSGSMPVFEGLALLVALKLRCTTIHNLSLVEVRSDSLTFVSALKKKSSQTYGINRAIREIAIMEALLGSRIGHLSHIPGKSNILPDILSRIHGPGNLAVPTELRSSRADPAPSRTGGFWAATPR